jgi:hypothetical protein
MRGGRVVRRCLINGEKVDADWRSCLSGNPRWDHVPARPAPGLAR